MRKNAIILGASLFMGCSSSPGAGNYTVPENKISVINGYKASSKDFPSIGALVFNDGMTEACTVSIIKKDLALTAAHCVDYDIQKAMVLYGKDEVFEDRCKSDDCAQYLFPIATAKVHSLYDDNLLTENHHDFALLLLKREITNAEPIEFLSKEDFSKVLRIGDNVTIAGYGSYNWELLGTTHNGKLFAADIPITGYYNFSEIIVGEKDPAKGNACFGDSGGPVYVYAHGQVRLTGVASRIAEPSDQGFYECGKSGIIYGLPTLEQNWIESEYKAMREKYPLEAPLVPEESKDNGATGGFSCQISSQSPSSTTSSGLIGLLLAGYLLRKRK